MGRAQKESREVARRGHDEYVPRPRSAYPSDRRSSEVVPATRRVEPSVDPARPRGPRRGGGRAVRPRESQVRTRRRLVGGARGPPRSTGAGEGSIDALRPGGERGGEEPEPSKVAGGVHALREQRVDLGVLEREVAGDADAVRDRVLIVKD